MIDLASVDLASLGTAGLIITIVLSIPPFLVLFSKRVAGRRKVIWVLWTGIFSWLAYVPFLLMTKGKSDQSPR